MQYSHRPLSSSVNHATVSGTQFGTLALYWHQIDDRIVIDRILLPCPGKRTAAVPAASPPVAALCRKLARMLQGIPVEFALSSVALDQCAPFQRSVLEAVYEIPRGEVSTYRQIARQINRPGSSRAVGTALATNPFPLIIPCHRVIRSDGFPGEYHGGATMKRTLLQLEGTDFDEHGKVCTAKR